MLKFIVSFPGWQPIAIILLFVVIIGGTAYLSGEQKCKKKQKR